MNPLHPFSVKEGPRFEVPPLLEALQEFQGRLAAGLPGMAVCGPPQTGKSTALAMLLEGKAEAGTAATFHTVLQGTHQDPSALVNGLLASTGTRISFYTPQPEQALIKTAQQNCDRLNTPRVILFVDKAEFLNKPQLDMLGFLVEELCHRKLAPFVGLFGRPELRQFEAIFKGKPGASEVVSLLARPHRMRGLVTDEVATALRFIDETRYPDDGPTYTEHFAPAFWRRGGRLETLAAFVEEFNRAAERVGRTLEDIPIGYLNSAVHAFCAGAAAKELSIRGEMELVQMAVELSGFAEALDLLGNLEQDIITPPAVKSRIGRPPRRT
jgi:hypothetical protein